MTRKPLRILITGAGGLRNHRISRFWKDRRERSRSYKSIRLPSHRPFLG
jgi:hypothetical protein